MTDAAFMARVLAAYERTDSPGSLFWRVDEGQVRFFAICNDLFWWATADLEEITPENVGLLESTAADVFRLRLDEYLSGLFAARARHMRPQKAWYATVGPKIRELFDTCGPERDDA